MIQDSFKPSKSHSCNKGYLSQRKLNKLRMILSGSSFIKAAAGPHSLFRCIELHWDWGVVQLWYNLKKCKIPELLKYYKIVQFKI